jgi:hypothetical protein
MATRAQIAYLDEDRNKIITTYNHYDGYYENLGTALNNHYNNDSEAFKIANRGYISYVNPETGEIEGEDKTPVIITGDDLDEVLRLWYDNSVKENADYIYLWSGYSWINFKMISGNVEKMIAYFMDEMMGEDEFDEENIEEGYEFKWKTFISEKK